MSFSSSLFDKIDGYFDGQKPHQVLRTTLASVVGAYYGYYALKEVQRVGFKKAIVAKIVGVAGKVVPGVDSKIRAEVDKEIQNLHNQFLGRCDQKTGQQLTVPTKGRSEKELLSLMVTWKDKEHSLWNGDNKVSGCVYHGGATLKQFQAKVMALFISSNPLHPTTFPFVRRMEAEVVSMCKNLFHGGAESCGVMSSGGTESILLAIHAYKEWALERGIEYPEVIKPSSAHPAFDKAAHYFGVKLVVVPVNQTTFTVDLADVRKAINKNTIALIGSAVNYPYGTLDDIEGLSKLAVDNNLGLHVDCCLGSILIAYMPKLGYPDHLFDFRLPGVTSISCDTHKYGFTPKGSSVIMWSRPELRRHHYYIIKNWPGGIYATPSMLGSRAGDKIAGTWATMVHLGEDGYLEASKQIMDTASAIIAGLKKIDGIKLCGVPQQATMAFMSDPESKIGKNLNVLMVAEAMGKRGWSMGPLQDPPAVHMSVSYPHRGLEKEFLDCVKASIQDALAAPEKFQSGSVQLYGMNETLGATNLLDDIVKGYIDMLTVTQ